MVAGSPKSATTVGSKSPSAASQSLASTVSKMESTNSMISVRSLMTVIFAPSGDTSGLQIALDGLDLGSQSVGNAGTHVGLEHEADPGRPLRDRVHRVLDDGHDLVPVTFDRGEHRVGAVGQPAGAHDADGRGDDFADALADAEWGDRESDEHASKASGPAPRSALASPRRAGRIAGFAIAPARAAAGGAGGSWSQETTGLTFWS